MTKQKESALQRQVLTDLAEIEGVMIFRNLTGKFRTLGGNALVTAGIVGSPDLMGWTMREVRPEDVGMLVPVFTGIELKTPTGRLASHQRDFLNDMELHGCIQGVARTREEATHMVLNAPWGVQCTIR